MRFLRWWLGPLEDPLTWLIALTIGAGFLLWSSGHRGAFHLVLAVELVTVLVRYRIAHHRDDDGGEGS